MDLHSAVKDIMNLAAQDAIMPRFRYLIESDVTEKQPGELVTIADKEAEELITDQLHGLIPGAVVIGEEACSQNPHLLTKIEADNVWLVDPLDGTRNFTEGKQCFAIMIALLRKGRPVASWMLNPVTGDFHAAEEGCGAFRNDSRLTSGDSPTDANPLSGSIFSGYMPLEIKEKFIGIEKSIPCLKPGFFCAGEEYPRIVDGDRHFSLFWRSLPWDHVPGSLLLTEAGGWVGRPNGDAYVPGDSRDGLLVARNVHVATDVSTRLALRSLTP